MSREDLQDRIQRGLGDTFRALAAERLGRLGLGIMSLEAELVEEADVDELLREIHTLKGEAKLVGMDEIGDLAHGVESLLHQARDAGWRASTEHWESALDGLDRIHRKLQGKELPSPPKPVEPSATAAPPPAHKSTPGVSAPDERPPDERRDAPDPDPKGTSPRRSILLDPATLERLTDLQSRLGQSHAADRTVQQKLEAAVGRAVEALRDPGGGTGRTTERAMEHLKEAAARLTELAELRFERGLSLQQVESALQNLRMVPLSALFAPLPRAARDLGRELGKSVRLELEGGDLAVDQQIHDRLRDPLVHLLRNAVDHGIEPAEERRRAGKPESGVVRVSADRRGAFVVITVADDGRGIDLDSVVAKAVDRGLLTVEEAVVTEPRKLLDLVFQPGFSTREGVSDISGRGIGLDVVRHSLEVSGGSASVLSRPGEGTTFRLVAPASSAFQSLLLVRAGSETLIGISASSIFRVLRLEPEQIKSAAGSPVFDSENELLPLLELGTILGHGDSNPRPEGPRTVVVVDHGGRRLGFRVDQVLGEESLVCHGLDPFLAQPSLIGGTAVRGGGSLVLVLNPAELIGEARPGERSARSPEPDEPDDTERARTVLVVDDSDLTRIIVCEMLRDLGYRVLEAHHGGEALKILDGETPDLLLVDLDMPVMSGFELLATLPDHPTAAGIPAVIFSSRKDEEDKRRCRELGAEGYLVKSEFSEQAFYRAVEGFLP